MVYDENERGFYFDMDNKAKGIDVEYYRCLYHLDVVSFLSDLLNYELRNLKFLAFREEFENKISGK